VRLSPPSRSPPAPNRRPLPNWLGDRIAGDGIPQPVGGEANRLGIRVLGDADSQPVRKEEEGRVRGSEGRWGENGGVNSRATLPIGHSTFPPIADYAFLSDCETTALVA